MGHLDQRSVTVRRLVVSRRSILYFLHAETDISLFNVRRENAEPTAVFVVRLRIGTVRTADPQYLQTTGKTEKNTEFF